MAFGLQKKAVKTHVINTSVDTENKRESLKQKVEKGRVDFLVHLGEGVTNLTEDGRKLLGEVKRFNLDDEQKEWGHSEQEAKLKGNGNFKRFLRKK